MKVDEKDMEEPVSSKRLRRKVLERWENEGGKICADPGKTSQSSTPRKRGRRTQSISDDILAKENDSSFSRKTAS